MSGAAIRGDALLAAALFAVDPAGIGGVRLRAAAGPTRDGWLDALRALLPSGTVVRKLPPGIGDERLLGGIDLAATLQAGRPIAQRGLLAEIDGGVLLAPMAERLAPSSVVHLNAVLDTGQVRIERDGLSLCLPSTVGVVALDEGIDDEAIEASLGDRLAIHLDLDAVRDDDGAEASLHAELITAARSRLGAIVVVDEAIEALCCSAQALGIASLRPVLLAVRVARAAAALAGRMTVGQDDLERAARLVLAPRATALPSPSLSPEAPEPPDAREAGEDRQQPIDDQAMNDVVLEAAVAAIPADLLQRLQQQGPLHRGATTAGRQGAVASGKRRGRPAGVRRGELRAGARLNVMETLRAAAPWQRLRHRTLPGAASSADPARLVIRKDDFRITRMKQKSATTTIFVVDASGSSALQRLAEVKGAVELLLADCYVRRDDVALIAFRGQSADILLPPTRSLTRAKRSLAALPGGGGTPLASAIVSATTLAAGLRRRGQSPSIVLMTDGRANVCRDGSGGREAAEAEAIAAARQLRAGAFAAVVVDTSPRPQPPAERIAREMNARYVALPFADAERLSRAVQGHRPGPRALAR